MRRKAGSIVILIILAVAALTGIAAAQGEEFTLESLAEQVAALVARVDALEELYAEPWSPDVIYKDDGVCQSPLHSPYPRSALMNSRVHQETADAYRSEYGVSIDPMDADLVSISFGVGSSHVYLEYEVSGKHVIEKWAHCEFMGHSEWSD